MRCIYTRNGQAHVINTRFDIINHGNLGMDVMHECNAQNFPLHVASRRNWTIIVHNVIVFVMESIGSLDMATGSSHTDCGQK